MLLHGVSAETGVGLAGMRERLNELNGTLEIESDTRGTRMRATVPLYAMSSATQLGILGKSNIHMCLAMCVVMSRAGRTGQPLRCLTCSDK